MIYRWHMGSHVLHSPETTHKLSLSLMDSSTRPNGRLQLAAAVKLDVLRFLRVENEKHLMSLKKKITSLRVIPTVTSY